MGKWSSLLYARVLVLRRCASPYASSSSQEPWHTVTAGPSRMRDPYAPVLSAARNKFSPRAPNRFIQPGYFRNFFSFSVT
jgi:hypothetical protein